jgi:hypothetical protein
VNRGDSITCISSSSQEACEKLRAHGVARITAFCAGNELDSLLSEARVATRLKANYKNPYGPCARFTLDPKPPELARSRDLLDGEFLPVLPDLFPNTRRFFEGDFFHETVDEFFRGNSGFMEVIAFTQDHIPDRKAVYGHLHFDRRHQLKFILYLNDVDEKNGAFGCIPDSHTLGDELFLSGWRKALGLPHASPGAVRLAAEATPEDAPQYHRVPCILGGRRSIGQFDIAKHSFDVVGAAGTLVVFDSHLLHFGGFVSEPGRDRWTLKGHTFAIEGSG